jgi:hypothetical protein
MVPSLLLLNALQQPLSFGRAQTWIADLAGAVDLHDIDAPVPIRRTPLHQTHDPAHAFSPAELSGWIIGHSDAAPNFSTVQ